MNTSKVAALFLPSIILSLLVSAPRSAIGAYGIAVGDNGVIRQTPDGGNWFPRSSGTTQTLRAVSCAGLFCWSVGDGGTILHSDDAGVTWNAQTSGTTQTLRGVDFVTRNHGWAVGDMGTILTTANGGTTWTSQDATLLTDLIEVKFVNVNAGWIGGESGTIRHTSDGGANWSFQSSGAGDIGGLDFTSATDGWYGAHGFVGKTTNGGIEWSRIYPDPFLFPDLTAIDFVTADQGVATGIDEKYYFTDDGGASWEIFQIPGIPQEVRDVSISEQGVGWAVGDGGALWKVIDGGRNWLTQSSGTFQTLWAVVAFNNFLSGDFNGDGFVNAADYVVWRKTDGTQVSYNDWRANFGAGQSGGGSALDSSAAVPEPSSLLLLMLGTTLVSLKRRRL